MTYTDALINIRWQDLPEGVRSQAKRCLRDIVGTAAGALSLPVSQQAADLVGSQFGAGGVPLWFRGSSCSAVGAAFCNAMTIDSLDCHDGFRPNKGHAGATVVPTLVGACVGRDISGRELLTALAMGYEIACRAGLALHAHYAPAYHSSGAWASFGAVAAGARVTGVRPDRIDSVVGMAEYYAPVSPMLRCTTHPSTVKDGAAAGAQAAAMALTMYAHGMEGLPSMLTAEPLGREQMETLGQDWIIMRQYFKPYPTCRWSQPAIEGVLHLQREHGFSHGDVERIDVETFREGAELMEFPPRHSDGAQYCTPWAVAAMLVDGALGVDQVHPSRLCDPAIIELGRRVWTHTDEDIQERFPEECLARTTVSLKNGARLTGPTMGARGDHADPLTTEELDIKFRALATRALGPNKCAELNQLLTTFEDQSVRGLLQMLAGAASQDRE